MTQAHTMASIAIAVAAACASSWLVAAAADASGALFRAKRTWWLSTVSSWTNGLVTPPTGANSYRPPAIAYVGKTANNPRFTAPRSFIKNTTYYFRCRPSTYCYGGNPLESRGWYSYWNAKGSFRPQNPHAPTETTTVRLRTTMSNGSPTTSSPHTAMYAPVTPTTTWGGRYDHSRGGSIMIWPGINRFGGTMRFLEGPNSIVYRLVTFEGPYTTTQILPEPLSQQIGTGVEIEIGEVTESKVGRAYRLTEPNHFTRLVIGLTSMGGPQYYEKERHYLVTRAPYTTGMVRAWEPLGNTNTIQTATGYDNRTPIGLNGVVSLVHPRLVHTYLVPVPGSATPIKMVWSAARLRKIDFRFLPEPAGIALPIAGLAALVGLFALRRCSRRIDETSQRL